MNRVRTAALLLVVGAMLTFGVLVVVEPAWALTPCYVCDYNYSNCTAGCSSQTCLNNCEHWYDVCWSRCYFGPYGSQAACINQCPTGFLCELSSVNPTVWICTQ